MNINIISMIEYEYENLIKIRRDFHKHPELSTQELRTSKKICEYLEKWNIKYENGFADTGVIGLIIGRKPGKTIALRADIDALPIKEKTGLEYESTNEGVMHACGHDIHTTILLGVGKVLKAMESEISGNVKLLFQPAEEAIGGAERMIKEGCLENPTVDYVLGLHVMPYLPVGKVELKYGKLNCNTGGVEIEVTGKSGHAAYPDTAIDAIVIACHIVIALQTLVSRNMSPLNSVVLSFGKISGGKKNNIITDKVIISGTLRCLDTKSRENAKKIIKRISENTAKAFGGIASIDFKDGYIALINNDNVMDVLVQNAKDVFGRDNIVYKEYPSLGGEDFSYFTDKIPGAFFHLGSGIRGKRDFAPLHSSYFMVDEECIKLGVEIQIKTLLKLLET